MSLENYFPTVDESLEPGFEKVALYALGGVPKHAARQLSSGRWSSKLGDLEDVEHTLWTGWSAVGMAGRFRF